MAGSTISTKTSDHPLRLYGAALGILVFLAGIALLGYVFLTAHALFETPPPPLPAPPPPSTPGTAADATNTASAATAISQSLVDFVKRLLLLLLMCIAGSVIASRGIELFFKACAAATPSKPAAPHGPAAASPAGASATAATSLP
jgi:hypothetical protein